MLTDPQLYPHASESVVIVDHIHQICKQPDKRSLDLSPDLEAHYSPNHLTLLNFVSMCIIKVPSCIFNPFIRCFPRFLSSVLCVLLFVARLPHPPNECKQRWVVPISAYTREGGVICSRIVVSLIIRDCPQDRKRLRFLLFLFFFLLLLAFTAYPR